MYYLDFVLVKGTDFEEALSLLSSELSSDKSASKLQSGSGSTAIPSTLCGQRSSNLIAALYVLKPNQLKYIIN